MTGPPADPVPGPVVAPAARTTPELGAQLGAEVWWCDRIFSLTGVWVPTTPEVVVRIHLAELSRVAGEHALALRAHLPRPAPVDPESWVRPPSDGAAHLLDVLSGLAPTAPRLAVTGRVLLTWLLAAWDRPRTGTAAASARAVGHARTDLSALRERGEGLLEALLLTEPTTVRAVHEELARIEASLVEAGGIHPPGPHRMPSDT